MPRFVRGQDDGETADHGAASSIEHPKLVELVNAYSAPLVPDRGSQLSVRDQHLSGICRPRALRDVAWRFGPSSR